MNRSLIKALRALAVAPMMSVTIAVGCAMAQSAPPGELPFGVYDPDGDFAPETEVVIEHLFLPWEDVFLETLYDADDYALERNRALLVTLEPWTWSRSERNTARYLRSGIESGRYDPNMTAVCEVLATLKSPVTLRFAHEMDDRSGQFIWAGWNADTYISAYRRMIDVCRASAPDITVMWSPLGDEDMAQYYPGDGYADLIGLTVFGLQAWDQAKHGYDRTFDEIFTPRYERAAAFEKPVVVAELGYVGKADYVDMWRNSVRKVKETYPQLVGVVYFNYPEVYPWPEGFGAPDWRIKNQVLE
ncbi:glycosyl hydrolase [Marimonas sp. MJW-29]|uniref:Glycosyl hydrolase n=1 Tax=Sulfitobacter sediminis TaxID=3234186 RepID=A0ABV3RN65_9RHOB